MTKQKALELKANEATQALAAARRVLKELADLTGGEVHPRAHLGMESEIERLGPQLQVAPAPAVVETPKGSARKKE